MANEPNPEGVNWAASADEMTAECPRGCTHGAGEPECGLDDAVAAGDADPDRVASFRRLLEARSDPLYCHGSASEG